MTGPNRTLAPPFKPFSQFYLKELKSLVINDQTNLHYVNTGSQAVIHIEVILKAGTWYESIRAQSYFMGKMLKEGTATYNSQQISTIFENHGAFLAFQPGLDRLSIGLYCLTKHFLKLLPVFNSLIFESVFPNDELETLKNIKIQSIKVQNEKNNVMASKIFRESLFGPQHPYGKYMDENDVKAISRDDLTTFHQACTGDKIEIILAGKFKDSIIQEVINQFNLKSQIKNLSPSFPNQNLLTGKQVIIEKSESLQSSIRMGKKIIPKAHEDFLKLLVVCEILGGYFGSRLMKNIREQKGFTYGIHASLVNFAHDGYLIIGTDVKKSLTAPTIDEIEKELRSLGETPIGYEELDTVKNYMVGTFFSSITSPFSLAEKFKKIYFHGLNYEYYKNYIQTIKSIDAQDILHISAKYLKTDNLIKVIVGGIS